ncbi:MAG: alpha/beta fold hydrolase [Allopontixanthobacter sediminis]
MKPSHGIQGSPASADLRARLALAREPKPRDAGGPPLRRLLAETQVVIEPVRRLARNLDIQTADHPRKVMLLPGFATHPIRMRYMARQLEKAGHKVKRWGLGFNFGPTVENFVILERRLDDLYQRYNREPVYLVGWSLGGLFARELAKRHPEKVARVVTMGSPFSGNPRANNAWRIYQFVTGHSVDYPPIAGNTGAKPPVFTTALWSPRDGIISPRSACGKPGERDRAVALRCTHLGFAYSEESIRAVLRELEEE